MKQIPLALLLPILLVGSFFLNIYIHEYGHYCVAEYFGLNPEVHFATTDADGNKISLYSPAAYTTYSSESKNLTTQDAIIAFAGPFVNLLFALVFCIVYITLPKKRKTFLTKTVFAMIIIPAIISFVINLIPVGISDGSIIVAALFP